MSKFSIIKLFSLKNGEEAKEKVLQNVTSNSTFKGATLWILACAMLIASIGLNVNSSSAIIGAMLISPLMGPIVGAGFALAIFDFNLLRRSVRNLSVAAIVSLLVSTLYFLLTPFKEAQSEILARTTPNIYDVLIAFVGGLVGVITITRVEKGNPIPGVAIATALMPPLCTAGYGIATGNFSYSLGALFLFSINAVFICISTFVVVKLLKYPPVHQVNLVYQKRVNYIITILIIVVIVPSVFFAYDLLQKQRTENAVDMFINKEFIENGNVVITKRVKSKQKKNVIELALLRDNFRPGEIDTFNLRLNSDYNLKNYNVEIIRNASILGNSMQIQQLKNTLKMNRDLSGRVDSIIKLVNQKDNSATKDAKFTDEIQSIYPTITKVDFFKNISPDSIQYKFILLMEVSDKLTSSEIVKLKNWVGLRLGVDSANIHFVFENH